MTINTPPTAAAVRIESRLRPEQVSRELADTAALEADIQTRITKYQPVIEKLIANVATSPENQTIATEALQLRVLSSLYGSAGQLSPAFWERSKQLKVESDELIKALTDDTSNEDATAGIGAGTLSTAPYRIEDDDLVINA